MEYVKKASVVVGFDLDGVIIDHTENKMLLAAERGWSLKPEDTPSDIIKEKLPLPVYLDMQSYLYGDVPTLKDPPLMDGVFSALRFLETVQVPHALISRRKNPEVAIALLERHGIVPRYFSPDRLFFVNEPEDKNKKARALGVTHFVDDEIRALSVLPDVSCRILFDPHGVFFSTDTYTRISSFHELIQVLQI